MWHAGCHKDWCSCRTFRSFAMGPTTALPGSFLIPETKRTAPRYRSWAVLFSLSVIGALYVLVQELNLETGIANEKLASASKLDTLQQPTIDGNIGAANLVSARALQLLMWPKLISSTSINLHAVDGVMDGSQRGQASIAVKSAKQVPWTTLTIGELMHNKMRGDPLRLVLPEAENQLLSVYR